MKKKSLIFLALSAMMLTACGGGGGNGGNNDQPKVHKCAHVCSKCSKCTDANCTDPVCASKCEGHDIKFKVTFKEEGKEDVVQQVSLGGQITKPADPTAPAGKKFYGWKNELNGGQIWSFGDAYNNGVYEDVTLTPYFIDSSLAAQTLEAELCPDITNFDIGGGKTGNMPGATYSGGQEGKGLIGYDYDGEFEATGVKEFSYNFVSTADEEFNLDLFENTPAGATVEKKTVKEVSPAFIHFMYVKGDTLTFEIESSAAAENVVLMGRFSAEYGLLDATKDDELYSTVTDKSVPITVNGTAIQYGKVTIHHIIDKSFLPFQDFVLSSNVSLKQGKNTIQIKVDNEDTLNGTIASSCPCIDGLKIFSTSTITWPTARYTNLIKD